MCFGGIFGCWLLTTVILLFTRGIYVAGTSVGVYLVAFVVVMVLGVLASRLENRSPHRDR
jgi:hypothetical protein